MSEFVCIVIRSIFLLHIHISISSFKIINKVFHVFNSSCSNVFRELVFVHVISEVHNDNRRQVVRLNASPLTKAVFYALINGRNKEVVFRVFELLSKFGKFLHKCGVCVYKLSEQNNCRIISLEDNVDVCFSKVGYFRYIIWVSFSFFQDEVN